MQHSAIVDLFAAAELLEHQREFQKVTDLYKKALGYGIPAVEVDGNDVLAVYSAMVEAVEHARAGRGPRFIECKTYRMAGHAAHDKFESYMPMELLAEWSDKDPLKRLEQTLRDEMRVEGLVMIAEKRQPWLVEKTLASFGAVNSNVVPLKAAA